jgi:4-amino-4-deoxy-L-arabinose transferase-like glycosyltransferase
VRSIRSNWLGLSLILVVVVLGTVVILYQTRYGPGTTGDSVRYLMGAENLLKGNGFSRFSGGGEIRPITMFPPFYSVVLAGFKLIGLDFYLAVRLLHALLFGANIFLTAFLIFRYTHSHWAALFGAIFILVAKDLVYYHTWVLTEALFIFFTLLIIYFLSKYFDSKRTRLLVFASILVGLATLTRYVGFSITMVGVVSILLFSDTSWKRRLMDCVLFGGISVAPILLWLWRNTAVSGTAVNRSFVYHPMSTELIQAYRAEVSFWFVPAQLHFPHSIRKPLMLLLSIPGPALFFLLDLKEKVIHRSKPRNPFWTLPWILAFFVFSYLGMLFINLTVLDAISDFNTVPRYLVPVYISGVILFIIVFHHLIKRWRHGAILRLGMLFIGLSLILLYAQLTFEILQDPIGNIGYTGFKQAREDTVTKLRSIDFTTPIISNDPERVYVLADRPAYLLPLEFDFHTTREREDFDQQILATREKLNLGGVIVMFTPMSEREKGVINILGAEPLDMFERAIFYSNPEPIEK